MHQQAADAGLDALLAFVDECELHEFNEPTPSAPSPPLVSRPHAQSCDSTVSSSSETSKRKSRPRRDEVEMHELQLKVAELEMELAHVIQRKEALSTRGTKRLQSQEWKKKAVKQSSMRSAAQLENEHLRAALQSQIQISKTLVNTLRRSSSSKVRVRITRLWLFVDNHKLIEVDLPSA